MMCSCSGGEGAAETDEGALLIDLYELLRCKLPFIRHQTGANCKVPFSVYIIPLIIVTVIQPYVIEIPIPGYELCTSLG